MAKTLLYDKKPRTLVGTGNPGSKHADVAVGTLFIDDAATNGNLIWVKTSPPGSAVWKLIVTTEGLLVPNNETDFTELTNALAAHLSATDPHGSKAYTDTKIAALVNGAPGILDTLGEIAAQLATDESAVSSLTIALNDKLTKTANLSDLPDKVAARNNLGLGSAATKNVGTASGTVAAGDDARFGSGSGSTITRGGIYIPKGALDRWKAARVANRTALAEVVIHGDSTTYGQVGSNAAGSAGEYSWVQKMRALSLAAGYGDGGVGLRGIQDHLNMAAPDTAGTYTLGTGAVAGDPTHNFHGVYGVRIAAVGDTFSFTFTGTRLRIWRSRTGTGIATPGGSFTYAIDGGNAGAPVSCQNTSTTNYDTNITTQSFTEGTHTVVFTCTVAGPCEIALEPVRTTGIVYHKQGISGVLLANEFPSQTATSGEKIPPRFGLGIGSGVLSTASNYGNAMNKTAGLRNNGLHILQLGLNDQNSSTSLADARTRADAAASGVSMFAHYCEQAGVDGVVCIPHLLYMTNARAYEGMFRQAIMAVATSHSLAVADVGAPLGGWANYVTYGTSVHLNQAGYDAQAQYLWDNILNAA